MERLLSELVERTQKAHGADLISVVLYGSAASPEGKDQRSDLNIFCVLREVTLVQLEQAEPVFRWWREMKNPAPILLSLDEVRTASDCFPIEFHDIKEHHRVLAGDDVVAGMDIDDAFYRAQVEHELRAKLLRLRQKAGGVLSENDLLLRLMVDSISTFCVLFRHSLRLMGESPRFNKREVIEAAHERFGIDPRPFFTLIEVREGKLKLKEVQPRSLFPQYLQQVQVVVDAVDRIER